jgi:hypothetical protein
MPTHLKRTLDAMLATASGSKLGGTCLGDVTAAGRGAGGLRGGWAVTKVTAAREPPGRVPPYSVFPPRRRPK